MYINIIYLLILFLDQSKISPKILTVDEGYVASFTCSSKTKAVWTHNKYNPLPPGVAVSNKSITILNVEAAIHAGTYVCSGTDYEGYSFMSRAELKVRSPSRSTNTLFSDQSSIDRKQSQNQPYKRSPIAQTPASIVQEPSIKPTQPKGVPKDQDNKNYKEIGLKSVAQRIKLFSTSDWSQYEPKSDSSKYPADSPEMPTSTLSNFLEKKSSEIDVSPISSIDPRKDIIPEQSQTYDTKLHSPNLLAQEESKVLEHSPKQKMSPSVHILNYRRDIANSDSNIISSISHVTTSQETYSSTPRLTISPAKSTDSELSPNFGSYSPFRVQQSSAEPEILNVSGKFNLHISSPEHVGTQSMKDPDTSRLPSKLVNQFSPPILQVLDSTNDYARKLSLSSKTSQHTVSELPSPHLGSLELRSPSLGSPDYDRPNNISPVFDSQNISPEHNEVENKQEFASKLSGKLNSPLHSTLPEIAHSFPQPTTSQYSPKLHSLSPKLKSHSASPKYTVTSKSPEHPTLKISPLSSNLYSKLKHGTLKSKSEPHSRTSINYEAPNFDSPEAMKLLFSPTFNSELSSREKNGQNSDSSSNTFKAHDILTSMYSPKSPDLPSSKDPPKSPNLHTPIDSLKSADLHLPFDSPKLPDSHTSMYSPKSADLHAPFDSPKLPDSHTSMYSPKSADLHAPFDSPKLPDSHTSMYSPKPLDLHALFDSPASSDLPSSNDPIDSFKFPDSNGYYYYTPKSSDLLPSIDSPISPEQQIPTNIDSLTSSSNSKLSPNFKITNLLESSLLSKSRNVNSPIISTPTSKANSYLPTSKSFIQPQEPIKNYSAQNLSPVHLPQNSEFQELSANTLFDYEEQNSLKRSEQGEYESPYNEYMSTTEGSLKQGLSPSRGKASVIM